MTSHNQHTPNMSQLYHIVTSHTTRDMGPIANIGNKTSAVSLSNTAPLHDIDIDTKIIYPFSDRTCGARRPHVGLCLIFLVIICNKKAVL